MLLLTTFVYAHDGHLSDKPWAACDDSELGDQCSYTSEVGDGYHGTCRAVSEHLICVRNKPIVKAVQQSHKAALEQAESTSAIEQATSPPDKE